MIVGKCGGLLFFDSCILISLCFKYFKCKKTKEGDIPKTVILMACMSNFHSKEC